MSALSIERPDKLAHASRNLVRPDPVKGTEIDKLRAVTVLRAQPLFR